VGVFAGQGDPGRSMALLWRGSDVAGARRVPGPKPGLTVDAIVEEAIAVADAHGMAGLSMRAVADRLGVTAMALYTYVPGKAELIDLMYDEAHFELPTEYDRSEGWRTAVTLWAHDLVAFYVRHPWVLQVSFARPVLGPNEQMVLEVLVGILRETGLTAGVVRRVVSVLFHLARGTAQTIAESRLAAAESRTSEREWWSRRVAALSDVVPDFAQRFPMSAWLASEGAAQTTDETTPYLEREANEALAVGLTVLLDGIDATRRPELER
jgi:AcrR family transcriptional regulator